MISTQTNINRNLRVFRTVRVKLEHAGAGHLETNPFKSATKRNPSVSFSPYFFVPLGRQISEHVFVRRYLSVDGSIVAQTSSGGRGGRGWHERSVRDAAETSDVRRDTDGGQIWRRNTQRRRRRAVHAGHVRFRSGPQDLPVSWDSAENESRPFMATIYLM